MYRNLLTELLLLCIIKIRKWILPACANGRQVKSGKKDKRKKWRNLQRIGKKN